MHTGSSVPANTTNIFKFRLRVNIYYSNSIRFSNFNRIRIRILFGFGKSGEYEYEYIRFWKIIRIRIRILFGLKISAEYEYEYHYSVSTIRILFEYRIIRSPLFPRIYFLHFTFLNSHCRVPPSRKSKMHICSWVKVTLSSTQSVKIPPIELAWGDT